MSVKWLLILADTLQQEFMQYAPTKWGHHQKNENQLKCHPEQSKGSKILSIKILQARPSG
jgi:hypothetical protein